MTLLTRRLTENLLFLVVAMFLGHSTVAAQELTLSEDWVEQLQWRSIGPANMSGRITALAVYEKDPCIWYAASASGGLIKTTNNGVSFEHQFDKEATVSIGDVQVFQGDPNIVWVGTGEANPRNSASWGNGVYRSDDGGKTWKHLGLDKTFQTGRIALHPEDPNIAYVGSLGRLWGPNEDRGLYKTTDGGESWNKVLFVNEMTGIIDVQMHPSDPNTLLVATYERERDGFDGNDPAKKYGEGSAIHRTTDGGATFTKVSQGLPTCKLGRIGLSWHRADPNIVFAIVESEKIGQRPENEPYLGITGADADVGARINNVVEGGPAASGGLLENDIVIAVNGDIVHSYEEFIAIINQKEPGDKLTVEVSRDRKSVELEITVGKREGESQERGGNPFTGTLGGQAANVQDRQGKNGYEHGGVYKSTDAGVSWTRVNTLNPRPMYYSQVRVDPSDASRVYVLGTSLYRSSDGGEEFSGDGGREVHVDHHALWIDPNDGRHMILGNDGGIYVTWDRMDNWDHYNHIAIGQFYHVGVGPRRNYNAYGGLQDNGSWGGPTRVRDGSGPVNSDWFRVGGGDGFVCLVDPEDPDQIYFESQGGAMGRIHLKTGERGFIRPRAPRGTRYRFNWKTPFILSPHNSKIHYSAGNHVFRSVYKGDGIQAISPDITNSDLGAGSALTESPREVGVLYVGTTDGALWMTKDGGQNWVNLFEVDAEQAAEAAEAAEEEPGDQPQAGRGGRGGFGGPGGGGRQGRGRGRFREMLMQRDSNKDGKLSREEAPEQFSRFFDRFDANGDGILDEKELAALGGGAARAEGENVRPPRPMQDDPADEPQEGDEAKVEEEKQEEAKEEESKDEEAKDEESKDEESKDEEATEEEAKQEEAAEESQEASEDVVSGTYRGKFISENIPEERSTFDFVLQLKPDGKISGSFESSMSEGEITGGKYDAAKNEITFDAETGQATLNFTASLKEGKMSGTIDINAGSFSLDFEATRSGAAPQVAAGQEAEEEVDDSKPIKELVPGPRWVSSLHASKFENGRCYMTLDGHRSNDDEPYVFVTENYGMTWTSIRANLPTSAGSTRVIREDPENADLLYLGCEFSAWVSIDRGRSWAKFNNNLPTVSIHEFAIHPTAGEIVAATHGRSLWVLDVTALRQFTKDNMAAAATLYKPNSAIRWRSEPQAGASGTRRFVGENPSTGADIYYSLAEAAEEVKLTICDVEGQVVRELEGEGGAGLHRLRWDLRRVSQNQGRGGRGGTAGRGGRGGRGRGQLAAAGTYLVKLNVDGTEYTQTIDVLVDPDYPLSAAAEDEAALMEALYGLGEEEEGGQAGEADDLIRE